MMWRSTLAARTPITGGEAKLASLARERFEIQRRLGAGGMGVVYEAIDRERGMRVALKTLKQVEAGLLYRFKGEFRKLADITHPNLVRLYELFSVEDDWFFTMELIDGEPFLVALGGGAGPAGVTRSSPTVLLERGEPAAATPEPARPARSGVDPARLRAGFRQLAQGVDALHRAGRLHRDLKPSNVLVARDGRVVICDFGLVIEPDGAGAFVTQDARLVGTAAYMSPEQAGRRALSPASDWYSVGVILYEALTGHVPFSGASADVLRLKRELDPPPARDVGRGVPPDLDALCARLLARAPEERPSAAEILAALGADQAPALARSAAPFVGRAAEIGALRSALDEVRAGRAVTLFVTGASGVGKTALTRRFLEEVGREDAVVLRGRCFERESVPYKAFDSLIDALSAYLLALPRGQAESLMPKDISALARLFPVLRRVDAVAEAPLRSFDAPEPRENRRRAFGALRELLTRLAARRLLVLCIDDLQWGDVDSAALLGALLRPPSAPPHLFLGCCRAEDMEHSPFVTTLLDREVVRAEVREIALDPLSPGDALDLSLAVMSRPSPDVAASIALESGGNPFFIEELAHHLTTGAALAGAADARPALDGMLRVRLLELPSGARALLEVVAVAGRALPRRVAGHAAGLAGAEAPAVDLLREQRLVRARADGGEDALETWHDRIREVAVACLGAEALRDCHARIAAALRSVGDADPQQLLDHLLAAGQRDQAYRHAVAAAARAAEALAFERASRLYGLALELGPGSSAGAGEVRELRRRMGDALASAGRGAESARAYLGALEGADAAENLELRRRAAEQLLRSGHFDEGLTAIAGVLQDVGLELPVSPRGALATLVWRRALRRLRGMQFKEKDESEIAPSVLRRLDVCWTAGAGLSLIDLVRGESFQAQHLLMALRAGEPYRIARAVAMETVYIASSGRFDERRVSALAAQATLLADRSGNAHARALAIVVTGIAAFMAGRWREGLTRFQEAEPIFREECTGVSWELATTHYFELGCLYYTGELGTLSARVPRLLREAEERSDLYAATSLRTWPSNLVWLAADDPARAGAEIDEAMRRWRYEGFQLQHLYELFARAQIDLYQGDAEAAFARLAERRVAMEKSLYLRARNIRVSLSHLEARACLLLAARGDRPRERIAAARRAARTMRRTAMPWCSALGALVDAGAEAATGDATGAEARFADAASACDAAGLGLFAAAARRASAELGGRAEAVAEADAWMLARGVKEPARMAALMAPGSKR